MKHSWTTGMVAALLLAGASGCVSQEQHDRALEEIQRLRTETLQRSREAATLRETLDRLNLEATLRPPTSMAFMRKYLELASSFAEVSARCGDPFAHPAKDATSVDGILKASAPDPRRSPFRGGSLRPPALTGAAPLAPSAPLD